MVYIMQNLADTVLEYYWFLNFCSEDELNPDTADKKIEDLVDTIIDKFSDAERTALQDAAKRSLALWLAEPDEYGYTPRKLLTPDKRAFLEDLITGNFNGPPLDETND
jgi:hypothetical protein